VGLAIKEVGKFVGSVDLISELLPRNELEIFGVELNDSLRRRCGEIQKRFRRRLALRKRLGRRGVKIKEKPHNAVKMRLKEKPQFEKLRLPNFDVMKKRRNQIAKGSLRVN
jgi:hypothetical protein